MSSRSLVIRQHRPWRTLLLLLVVAVLAAAGGALGYARLVELASTELSTLKAENRALAGAVREHEAHNSSLRQRLAIAQRESQVEREAYAEVQRTLRSLQDQVLDLKEELAFYRGIATSGEPGSSLAVQSLRLIPAGSGRRFRYKLVLTRSVKNDKVAEGSIGLAIAGEHDGDAKRLTLGELGHGQGSELAFRFKHFQRLEGELTLPEGFVPQRVSIVVKAPDERPERIEKTYEWPALTG